MGCVGLGGVSRDSYPSETVKMVEKIVEKKVFIKNPNPDPKNWKFLRSKQYGKYLLVKIKYPDCTNYEGDKILLYQGITMEELIKQKLIDPHFSNNALFKSPIARFEPTEKGWYLGETLAMHCDTITK